MWLDWICTIRGLWFIAAINDGGKHCKKEKKLSKELLKMKETVCIAEIMYINNNIL